MNAKSDSNVAKKAKDKPCTYCGGVGRVADDCCNCGSGEGCTAHNASAISMWGPKCPSCGGTGKQKTTQKRSR